MDTSRTRYSGLSRKLVVALDIGTTFSGAAYALLDPGEVPQIQSVTRYPNTPNLGSAKIPSILYYDHDGKFCGVENGNDFQDEDAYLKLRWWKLLISPTEPSAAMKEQMSTQLPKGKTIVDVFADFMGFLFDSTKELFIASEPNGELRWDSISDNIELVLTHPNGWGGPQQTHLRTAAVLAGIVPDTPAGHSSVNFVTEGEASFNFCATHTQAGRDLKPGEEVLIIDAGGGTIDISAYTVLNNQPLQVEELYVPKCLLQGGEFVTARARAMVRGRLRGSRFNTPEDLEAFAQRFDDGVKRLFSNDQVSQYVKFGSPRDNDPKCGIKAGRLTLTGAQVSECFAPSIETTVISIGDNFSERLVIGSSAFLVGGFATSPWLSNQLEKQLQDIGLKVCKPDTHTNKAVAVGAVSFYVDHFVTGRISKFTYGTCGNAPYNPFNPEHTKRERLSCLNPAGEKHIPGHFTILLPRGTKVLEDREVRSSYCYITEGTPRQQASQSVIKYTGADSTPEWMDTEQDKFEVLCSIQADLTTAPCQKKLGKKGRMCFTRTFDVILQVGLTELKAQIGWFDSITGEDRRTDAVVVYDNPSERITNDE